MELMKDALLSSSAIQCFPILNREQWLALRREDITASVAGALLGVHEYETAYGLWMLRTGQVAENTEQTASMERGELLEPVAIALLKRRKPEWLIRYPVGQYYRDPAARLGGTPDAIVESRSVNTVVQRGEHKLTLDEVKDRGIIQIKSVEASVFRRKWRTPEGVIEPPLWIAVQALVEAYLTGSQWACVAALVVGYGLDLHIIDIPLKPAIIERLKIAVAEFWKRVETDTPPDPDYAKDHALIAELYGVDKGTSVDLSSDNLLPALLDEAERLESEIKERDVRRTAIKAEVLDKLGTNRLATLPNWIIRCPTINRKAYQVAATSYRRLTFNRTQEKAS